MADVYWPGRVGAHIFDVDRPLAARRAGPETQAVDEDHLQNLMVNLGLQHDVDEARPGGFGAQNIRLSGEIRDQACGQGARIRTSLLGFPRIDHSRVGREITVGRVPRRLDSEAAKIEAARQFSDRDPFLEQPGDARLEVGENVHFSPRRRRLGALRSARLYRKSEAPSKRRPCSAIAKRSVMPAI